MDEHFDILAKNLLIRASAGSGKTYQLGNRVIGLISHGARPESLVALTFTRKAAGEFTDSVLNKLAAACADAAEEHALRVATGSPDLDARDILARLIAVLPRVGLGTMDGFFARIVRSFQYDLGITGGKFELVQGPRADALRDTLLATVLGTREPVADDGFLQSFQRATHGDSEVRVSESLRDFTQRWHELSLDEPDAIWGPDFLATVPPESWEERKHQLASHAAALLDDADLPSRAHDAVEKLIGGLERHRIGAGGLDVLDQKAGESLLADAAAGGTGEVSFVYYKSTVTLPGRLAGTLRDMLRLAAACESAAAVARTRAMREVVDRYDRTAAAWRTRGMLDFSGVKRLLGRWAHDEDARLRRERVDYHLDGRIDHWLLDEFQDTSTSDWAGLEPLVGEAVMDPEGSVFIVGDRKQAIYGWRGGDVSLFDKLAHDYPRAFQGSHMEQSQRSCPEVLALVNRVCGDLGTMRTLFGPAATDRWEWQDHTSAPRLASAEKRGHACVEQLTDKDEWLARIEAILTELGIGKRDLTCGILLRKNKDAREVADFLRAKGYDVSEDGERQPGSDHLVGILTCQCLRWLANPSDTYARLTIEMSPLATTCPEVAEGRWADWWQALSCRVANEGFARTFAALLDPVAVGFSPFGKRRVEDILTALREIDTRGILAPEEAADWLERLNIPQTPGSSAVQVLTIHKSKGLGFDVVLLPRVPTDSVPDATHYRIARADTWLCQVPPKWARALIPEHVAAEREWGDAQAYEAFCMLYVALTRAKRGLHVLLDPPSKSVGSGDRPSLANWLRKSLGEPEENGVLFTAGDPAWTRAVPPPPARTAETVPALAP